MGHVHEIVRSNWFGIQNLTAFKEGLKGFAGEFGNFHFSYEDVKRRSKKANINISSEQFDRYLENDREEQLDILAYIQLHIQEGDTCTLHAVSYEHALDLSISKYTVTSDGIVEDEILA